MNNLESRDPSPSIALSSATSLSLLGAVAMTLFARPAMADCPDPERPAVTTSQSLGVPSVSLNYYAVGSRLCFKQQHIVYECTQDGWKKTPFNCSFDQTQSDDQSQSDSKSPESEGGQSSGQGNSSAAQLGEESGSTTNQSNENTKGITGADTTSSESGELDTNSRSRSSAGDGAQSSTSQQARPPSSASSQSVSAEDCNSMINPIVQECMKPYYGSACEGAKVSESCFQRAIARGSGVCPDSLLSQFREEEQQAESIERSVCAN
jgi:hypothetical protein